MSSADLDPDSASVDSPRSRRELLRSGGAAAIVGLLGVFGVATSAAAKNGQAVRAGEKTTASRPTTIESRKGTALQVRSSGGKDAVAVSGEVTSKKGKTVGIHGISISPDGVAGRFSAASGGTAVEANAAQPDGVALRTKGRLELGGRSGVNQVSGGAEFVIPVEGGLTDKSIVLATLQDHNPGVHVESATVLDADDGLIVVRLNQALAEPASVGWIVLD